jgi:hypothetical protein
MRYALVCILFLSGCANTHFEASIGPFIETGLREGGWEGRGGVVDLAVRYEFDNDWSYCEYRHTSNLLSGWPFNFENEGVVDRVSCGVKVGGR